MPTRHHYGFKSHYSTHLADLAQLGERLPYKQEVTGSIPVVSTSRGVKRNITLGP